jgi:exopolysaccharide biosynthesis polyprenyl glycosylphosphotransferase
LSIIDLRTPGDVSAEAHSATPEHAKLRWRRNPKVLLVLADFTAVVLALGASIVVAPMLWFAMDATARNESAVLAAASLPAWPLILARYRLYSSRYVSRGIDELRRVVLAVIVGVLTLAVLSTALQIRVSRGWLTVALVFGIVTVGTERCVARMLFARYRRSGRLVRRVLIVGRNAEGLAIERMFLEEPGLGYEVIGFVDDGLLPDAVGGQARTVGTVAQTMALADAAGAKGVIIAATAMDLASSNLLIRELTDAGVHVELSSTLRDIAPHRLTVRPLGRFPVVYIEPVKNHGWRAVAKRTFDASVAGVCLLVTLPLLLVAALVIAVDSRGPVFFRQLRVGKDGKTFNVVKLRTMVADAEARRSDLMHLNERSGPLFKIRSDPRVTRVGRFRRLWNVLRGEMSLVGPRPALPNEIADWSVQLHQRLRVRPGITGMWQVHGRGSESFELYERLDLFYVDNWSLVSDLAILAKTLPAVLSRRGAS